MPSPPSDPALLAPDGNRSVAGPSAGAAFLAFCAISVVLTWPLAIRLASSLPAGNNDLWQNVWNFWWWKRVLLTGDRLPWSTDLLFHPGETSLAFHTHSAGNIILTLPVLLVWGEIAAHQLAVLAGFILAAHGAFLLAREVVRDGRAAFVAGMIFAFVPQHLDQSLEHLNLASTGGIPLFLWALLRATRQGGRRRWITTALLFALNALFGWHNAILSLPPALFLFLLALRRIDRPLRKVLLEAGGAAALAILLILPFAWPMLSEILAGATHFQKPPVRKPIDLAFLFIPSERHSLWGALVEPAYAHWRRYASVGSTGYLGLVALALAARGLLPFGREGIEPGSTAPRPRPGAAAWLAIFLGYLVLSLGRELRVAGTDTGVPLPFAAVSEWPLLGTTRLANRFLVPAALALAVLAAAGAARLLARARRPGLFAFGLSLLVGLDFLSLPYPLRPVPRPAWTAHVTGAPRGSVLDIPGGYRARAAEDMYAQTLHGRPLVGGYVSATPPRVAKLLARHPILHTFFEAHPSVDPPLSAGLQALFDDLPIAVVVIHLDREREWLLARQREHEGEADARLYNPEKGMERARMNAIRREMRRRWGKPWYRDRTVELFRRPERPPRDPVSDKPSRPLKK